MIACMTSPKAPKPVEPAAAQAQRRPRVSQADVPRIPLSQALRVPRALADHYAKQPAKPLDVAAALDMSPTSGPFRELCGAAVGYGLTDGGPNATQIGLTSVGSRVVAPLEEGDDLAALRQAVLVPSVQKQFLEKYDGNALPAEHIAMNVLEALGVPREAVTRVFGVIVQNAEHVGFLKKIKDKTYVDLAAQPTSAPAAVAAAVPTDDVWNLGDGEVSPEEQLVNDRQPDSVPAPIRSRKVFVSHGKSKRVVEQLKELLQFGDFEPIVSVERESVSKPVPQKVLDDMRTCAAGIIHVKPEERLMDPEGNERRILNQNVLIEIGAAMALYGDHFILLVEDGTTLPSNLQGLYEVRYSGDELGYEATMKVLKALNQFKSGSTAVS